jgi:tripartite-type tricarboxylate transporter receptor subunit TctC
MNGVTKRLACSAFATRCMTALRALAGAALVIATITTAPPARAAYPERPVKVLVPYQAGGATDLVARLVAQKLTEEFKQAFIVENRPGAGGMIAVSAVAKAAPDGYTILIDAPGIVLNPSLYRKVLYETKDLQPVAQLMTSPFVIVTNPSLPIRSVDDVADYARKNASKFNVATAGNSTLLAAQMFRLMANVELTFVPYNGAAPASMSVVSGDTQMMLSDLSSFGQLISSGRLRAIAVASDERSPLLPDVPTTREAGMPDYLVSSWFGAFVPAATPIEIVRALHEAFNRAVDSQDVIARLATFGAQPVTQSVDEFSRFYRDEVVRWKDVVTRAKVPLIE